MNNGHRMRDSGNPAKPRKIALHKWSKTSAPSVGTKVVYPAHGVGVVQAIKTETIAGSEVELVRVAFEDTKVTVMIPVFNMDKSGLRPVQSREQMAKALSVLASRPKSRKTPWIRKSVEFEGKINSGDPKAVAEVLRDVGKPGDKGTTTSEKMIQDRALARLAQELAAVEGVSVQEATTKVLSCFAKEQASPEGARA